MLEGTDAITKEVLELITFVLAYPTVHIILILTHFVRRKELVYHYRVLLKKM